MADCDRDEKAACNFKLCDYERELFDGYAQEQVAIAGTDVDYYSLSIDKSTRDALYDEPEVVKYYGPYRMRGFFEFPDTTPEAREQGLRTEWSTTIWIARTEFERTNAHAPIEGDIIQVWDTSFFEHDAVDEERVPGAGLYLEVIKADHDGHMFDTPTFVGFKLELRRRSEFTPERKLAM